MFAHYVCEGVFCWHEFERDTFDELFWAYELGYYSCSRDSETDYYNALEYWDNNEMFREWLTDKVKEFGFVDYDKDPQNGTFMWIQAEEMLVVQPSDSKVELPMGVVATFDRDSLYEMEYAQGIVRDGVFYATTIARELD